MCNFTCSVWVDCIASDVYMNSVLSAGIKLYVTEKPSYYLSKKFGIPRACDFSMKSVK